MGYHALANAIIEQAAKDYMAALRVLKNDPDRKTAMQKKVECEKFFKSRWFHDLTEMDPDYLIRNLRKETVS